MDLLPFIVLVVGLIDFGTIGGEDLVESFRRGFVLDGFEGLGDTGQGIVEGLVALELEIGGRGFPQRRHN